MIMRFTKFQVSSKYTWVAAGVAAAGITFFHLWQIADLPRGLYVDESSIGYNAALVAQTLHDEHGAHLPIYFKAFGEYKHPLYIYTVALLYKVFGVSLFWLRFASFLFFAIFIGVITAFARRLYRGVPATTFTVLAAAFLPWFFPMSRIAFEVVSQLPVLAGGLLCTYLAFHGRKNDRDWYAVLAGAFIGLSLYTYSSSKLWVPLQLIGIGLIYGKLHMWRRIVLIAVAAVLVSLPAISFSLSHHGAFTARFRTVTYIYDQSKTLPEKALEFTQNYTRHFNLSFLVWTGDTNLRHAIGYSGELFGIVAILAVAGIYYAVFRPTKRGDEKFYLFLLFNLLIAPIPAALTLGDTGHSLRTTLMGIALLLFAGYGFMRITTNMRAAAKPLFTITVITILIAEAGLYLQHYFTDYIHTSIVWFESYGFEQTLDSAISQHPEHILVSSQGNAQYIQTAFYGEILRGLDRSFITTGPPRAAAETCLILSSGTKVLNLNHLKTTAIARIPESRMTLRCY